MGVFLKRRELLLSDDVYKINLYVNNSLYTTLEVTKGEKSKVLGAAVGEDNTYEFYGWSTSPASTTISYTSTSSIKPTANMNLYAVFKHYVYSVGSQIYSYKYVAPESFKTYYFKANSNCTLKIYGVQNGSSTSGEIYKAGGNVGLRHFYINDQNRISTPDSTITENGYNKYVYNLSAGDIIKIVAMYSDSGSNYKYTFTIYGTSNGSLSELTLDSEEYVLFW